MMEPFALPAAWSNIPHPREPLRKGLAEAAVEGFSGNRKDLKCVVRRRRRPSSVSIDSHVRTLLHKYCTVLFY
jgi:hypothetical protein